METIGTGDRMEIGEREGFSGGWETTTIEGGLEGVNVGDTYVGTNDEGKSTEGAVVGVVRIGTIVGDLVGALDGDGEPFIVHEADVHVDPTALVAPQVEVPFE